MCDNVSNHFPVQIIPAEAMYLFINSICLMLLSKNTKPPTFQTFEVRDFSMSIRLLSFNIMLFKDETIIDYQRMRC